MSLNLLDVGIVIASIIFIFLLVKLIIIGVKNPVSFDQEMDELTAISITECIVLIFLTIYIILECIFEC